MSIDVDLGWLGRQTLTVYGLDKPAGGVVSGVAAGLSRFDRHAARGIGSGGVVKMTVSARAAKVRLGCCALTVWLVRR